MDVYWNKENGDKTLTMKNLIVILILSLLLPLCGASQITRSTLIDSVLNNQLSISAFNEKLDHGNYTHQLPNEGFKSARLNIECDNDSEILVQIGDSLYIYNFDLDNLTYLTKEVHGISASFGYLGGNENKIVTAVKWDSVYYFIDSSWVYSGFLGKSASDLIHTASGNKSSFFMGGHLWFYNGSSNPKLIRNNISYTVADLAVDERENAWVLTGKWPIADTLRIIDSTGISICDIPFDKPINTFNGYGMLIRNGKAMVGFGSGNPVYPNSLVPLEISPSGNSVSFGTPILHSSEFTIDLAGCSKNIMLPTCNMTNTEKPISYKDIVTVWPNPFYNQLFVSANSQTISSIKIYDVYGKNYAVNYNTSSLFVDLNMTTFPAGIYIIYIELNGENMQIKKIIKG